MRSYEQILKDAIGMNKFSGYKRYCVKGYLTDQGIWAYSMVIYL